LNQNQFDTLVSLAYNIGAGAFASSTAAKLVKQDPNDKGIPDAIKMWNKGGGKVLPGLVTRRESEAQRYTETD
jgi:lysozyme